MTPDRWVRVWRERMPDVPLAVVPVDDVTAALTGGVTMVFARLPIDGDGLHVIPLWEETPVVVAAKDHPVKLFEAVTEADLAAEELYPGWDEAVLDIVAAGHGIARMPQSVFRATGRRDVVARPITDAAPTRIGLVWSRDAGGPLVDEFIGVVRGRTANSSRGAPPEPPAAAPERPPRPSRPRPERSAKKRPRRR
ncbi:LysR substrate-binding domain-containing protein [Amnibacterium kyonggiense]